MGHKKMPPLLLERDLFQRSSEKPEWPEWCTDNSSWKMKMVGEVMCEAPKLQLIVLHENGRERKTAKPPVCVFSRDLYKIEFNKSRKSCT